MIEIYEGDIFDAPITILVHQCNCLHIMGGGLAFAVKKRFPEAYEADKKTLYRNVDKLGSYSVATVFTHPSIKHIINLYGQFDIGDGKRTSYDALHDGFTTLNGKLIEGDVVGIPYGLGCGLGGGSWDVVNSIIEDRFKNCKGKVLICRKP